MLGMCNHSDMAVVPSSASPGQAGYAPPPPGTNPSQQYARAYYRAHAPRDFGGPVQVGGR